MKKYLRCYLLFLQVISWVGKCRLFAFCLYSPVKPILFTKALRFIQARIGVFYLQNILQNKHFRCQKSVYIFSAQAFLVSVNRLFSDNEIAICQIIRSQYYNEQRVNNQDRRAGICTLHIAGLNGTAPFLRRRLAALYLFSHLLCKGSAPGYHTPALSH